MSRKSVLVLCLSLLLPSLLYVRFTSVNVKASNSYPVSNLDTGLNYTTIQEAIDANETLDGHTIYVEEGTYHENVVINKTLSLIGESKVSVIIDGNGTGNIVLIDANNVTVRGFTLINGDRGILCYEHPASKRHFVKIEMNDFKNVKSYGICALVDNSWILNNSVSWNEEVVNCISVDGDSNFILDSKVIYNHGNGVGVSGDHNLIAGNLIQYSAERGHTGLAFSGDYNIVERNEILNNEGTGVASFDARYSIIRNNTISENLGKYAFEFVEGGLRLGSNSFGNKIYHNNFIDNLKNGIGQAKDDGESNEWDNGYPSGGNYWSDYDGVDVDLDGIGDTPYDVAGSAGSQDRYPLMTEAIVPEFPSFLILPLFMIATLLVVIVYKRKHQTRNKKRGV